ncbi:uncharacterized protein LOC106177904 isoform X2 [Lingula anatina]|nr:uncharacterized protein LOC106162716 isoform X2 [Lingula anatina]XP_013395581.1 uncharacterized protein LOC106162716 isoform X2 [Lingula anatina]XP_013416303.1 uncharacterized protein LOC106177904 isoform X2 [Lingula anatina]XP_013416304.1 uncharacterized protein LOC106177904 isoform X2 [Lingula anatina]|eukprot:XP_013395573.1 uncharacterized protein LOC106162716 isoform X2 [Lingula anatina]
MTAFSVGDNASSPTSDYFSIASSASNPPTRENTLLVEGQIIRKLRRNSGVDPSRLEPYRRAKSLLSLVSSDALEAIEMIQEDWDTSTGEGQLPKNLDAKVEKEMILRSRLQSASKHRLPHQLIQKLKRPAQAELVPYGVPNYTARWKDRVVTPTQETIDEFIGKRTPSFVQTHPRNYEPTRCGGARNRNATFSQAFCDVLGPSSCSYCIEKTNRALARKVQNYAFPPVDATPRSLVAPNLGHILAESYKTHCIYCKPVTRDHLPTYRNSYRYAPKQRVERPYRRSDLTSAASSGMSYLPKYRPERFVIEKRKSKVHFQVKEIKPKSNYALPYI